jgi:hypothetical protein
MLSPSTDNVRPEAAHLSEKYVCCVDGGRSPLRTPPRTMSATKIVLSQPSSPQDANAMRFSSALTSGSPQTSNACVWPCWFRYERRQTLWRPSSTPVQWSVTGPAASFTAVLQCLALGSPHCLASAGKDHRSRRSKPTRFMWNLTVKLRGRPKA